MVICLSPSLVNTLMEVLVSVIKQEKEISGVLYCEIYNLNCSQDLFRPQRAPDCEFLFYFLYPATSRQPEQLNCP